MTPSSPSAFSPYRRCALAACLASLFSGSPGQAAEDAASASATPMPAYQAQPVPQGQRVFTAGHSFHAWVYKILDEVAKSAGIADHQVAGVSSIGASWVIQHWNVPDEKNELKRGLTAGQIDVLTLSPIWLPDPGIEKFALLGQEHNPNLRIMVQEYWLPNDTYAYDKASPINTHIVVDHNAATVEGLQKQHDLYFRDMDNYVADINKKVGRDEVLIAPVGQAVLLLRAKVIAGQAPGIKTQAELFHDNWGHPNEAIKALAAYVFFAMVYHRSPVGLPVPSILTKSPTIPSADLPALNLLLQQLAWDAVTHHPMSGVKAAS